MASNYVQARTSNTSSPIANPLYQMSAYGPPRFGKGGLATTEKNTPPCCAKHSSLSNCSSQTLHHKMIRVGFGLGKIGRTLHSSQLRICPIPPTRVANRFHFWTPSLHVSESVPFASFTWHSRRRSALVPVWSETSRRAPECRVSRLWIREFCLAWLNSVSRSSTQEQHPILEGFPAFPQ